MKKLVSAILSATLLLASCPVAFAASDIENHWAKQYISYLSDLKVMNPSAEGEYKPGQTVRRDEFMRYLNRAFGFTEKAQISFTDVPATDKSGATMWNYEPVQIAVAHGYINGVGNNKMDPAGLVTREQAATIIGRLHKMTPKSSASSVTFTDKAKIQSWSMDYIGEAVQAGYLVGYPDGSFKPQGTITRAEMAKILYSYMGTSLDTAGGTYTGNDLRADTKNVSISNGCTLSNAAIKGDLYITEGVMNQSVTLQNVTVDGNIIVSGGAVTLDGVTANKMVVSTPLALTPSVTATGNTNIGVTEVQTSCLLDERNLDVSAGGIADITVSGTKNPSISLDAVVWDITADGPASISTTSATAINTLTAKAKVDVTGAGSLQKAVLNASGCSLSMEPVTLELGSGVTATIAGETTSSANSVTVTPGTLSFDVSEASKLDYYMDFKLSGDPEAIAKLSANDKALTENSDYRTTDDGFRLYQKFLTSLKEGAHHLTILMDDGSRGVLTITVTDASKNYIDPATATFNRYQNSLDYANVSVTLQLAKGVTLTSIKFDGATLDRGSDYTYNASSGTVVLQRTMLEKKSTGSYTLTFNVSNGNSPTLKLNIEDSSPKNAVAPTSVDFDANSAATEYQDVTVELQGVDGAQLKSIKCGDKTLQEDWQYKLSGSSVILSKAALADLAKNDANYANLIFVMSAGDNPTLRVNFVTTYPVKVTLVDDLKKPIEGADITLAPSGESASDGGTPLQTRTTSSEGVATFYVKRGTYVATAANDKFEQTVTQKVNVSTGQTLTLTASIMETVNIYVTSSTGANLEGATVALGGQTVTTGKDGLASFSVKRGTYTARVACAGYKTESKTLTVDKATTERIKLSK